MASYDNITETVALTYRGSVIVSFDIDMQRCMRKLFGDLCIEESGNEHYLQCTSA